MTETAIQTAEAPDAPANRAPKAYGRVMTIVRAGTAFALVLGVILLVPQVVEPTSPPAVQTL